jgi:hypothetical protein
VVVELGRTRRLFDTWAGARIVFRRLRTGSLERLVVLGFWRVSVGAFL